MSEPHYHVTIDSGDLDRFERATWEILRAATSQRDLVTTLHAGIVVLLAVTFEKADPGTALVAGTGALTFLLAISAFSLRELENLRMSQAQAADAVGSARQKAVAATDYYAYLVRRPHVRPISYATAMLRRMPLSRVQRDPMAAVCRTGQLFVLLDALVLAVLLLVAIHLTALQGYHSFLPVWTLDSVAALLPVITFVSITLYSWRSEVRATRHILSLDANGLFDYSLAQMSALAGFTITETPSTEEGEPHKESDKKPDKRSGQTVKSVALVSGGWEFAALEGAEDRTHWIVDKFAGQPPARMRIQSLWVTKRNGYWSELRQHEVRFVFSDWRRAARPLRLWDSLPTPAEQRPRKSQRAKRSSAALGSQLTSDASTNSEPSTADVPPAAM